MHTHALRCDHRRRQPRFGGEPQVSGASPASATASKAPESVSLLVLTSLAQPSTRPKTCVAAPEETRLYSPRRATPSYEATLERAEPMVASGRLAILDASFETAARPDQARLWARENGAPFCLIEIECQESAARHPPAKRQAAGEIVSEAGPDSHATHAARFEPPGERPRETRLRLQIDGPSWRYKARRELRSLRSQSPVAWTERRVHERGVGFAEERRAQAALLKGDPTETRLEA